MKLPSISGRELVKILIKFGFEVVRQRGSHVFLRHKDGRTTVIPVHAGETIDEVYLTK
jgi:predicted RNA binding protein YcfA (HicA-like mRNA interferase family)